MSLATLRGEAGVLVVFCHIFVNLDNTLIRLPVFVLFLFFVFLLFVIVLSTHGVGVGFEFLELASCDYS